MEYYAVLLPLALILLLSKTVGIGLQRLGVPQVIGMILSGILVGLIGFIPNQSVLSTTSLEGLSFLAKIGVVIIMFSAGLDTDLKKVKQTGVSAIVITALGVAVPLVFGFVGACAYLGFDNLHGEKLYSALFYGVILTATSVSVTVATLKELGKLDSPIGTAIISAAIIDDIIGIILLSLIIGIGGSASAQQTDPVWLVLVKTVAFFALAIGLGLLVRWLFGKLAFHHHHYRRLAIYAFALCFFYAYAAEHWFGVADITGAFVAGLVLSGLQDSSYIDRKADISTYMIFGPVFFANIGIETMMQVVKGEFSMDWKFALFGVGYVALGLLGKFVGCSVGAKLCRFDTKDSLRAGIGMMCRAEVVLICTQKGINAGLVDSAIMPFVLAIILISSFVTPILLKASYRHEFVPQEPLDLPDEATENTAADVTPCGDTGAGAVAAGDDRAQ